MKWIIYNILFAFVYLALLPRFFVRMWRRGGYRRGFLERFGIYTSDQKAALSEKKRVWIHAVSVGEMFVGLSFARELRIRNQNLAFVFTTTTSTGHALARANFDKRDVLLYVPLDFPVIARRAIRRIQPLALMLVEGEVWPNIVRCLSAQALPVALINARLSEKSFTGFSRMRTFVRDIYSRITLFAAQGQADAERYIALGAPEERVAVFGAAKYDMALIAAEATRAPVSVLERAGFPKNAMLILGGSTWPGEERILLDLFCRLKPEFPAARLVVVPRHAERAEEIEAEIKASGLSWIRRSSLETAPTKHPADVMLVDTTGELKSFYAAATVVFVGKSLTAHGGQNIMEPAALAKPIIVGPNMENFAAIMADFLAARAAIQVASPDELARRIAELLRDPAARECFAERASRLVREKSGVIPATVERLMRDIPQLAC